MTALIYYPITRRPAVDNDNVIRYYMKEFPVSTFSVAKLVSIVNRAMPEYRETNRPSVSRQINPGAHGGLTESERARLPRRQFAVPEKRSWPIHDQQHSILAITYMERGFGSRADYPEIEREISRRYASDPKVMKALSYYRNNYKD